MKHRFPSLHGKCALLLALLVPFAACTKSGDDGPSTNACSVVGLSTKIVNGSECSTAGSPIVQLTILTASGGIGTCSGTLLTPTKVLSAAHCFQGSVVKSVSARVEGIDVPVPRGGVVLHPEVQVPQNDVAIVTLSRPVTTVSPVPLLLSRPVEVGDIISVLGYGTTGQPNTEGVLRSGEMRVSGVNSQDITAIYNEEGSNTCFGDSGGPALLTVDDVTGVVGVTSFGTSQDCSKGDASAFANVQGTAILSFITAQVPDVQVQ
jgi:hypothetical protein